MNSNCQVSDSCNHRTNEPGTESQNTGQTACNSNRRTLGFDTHLTVQKSLGGEIGKTTDVQSPKKGYTPLHFLIYVLVCTAQTTKSMKTNDIPLKSPMKLQQDMQKKNSEFSKIC